MKRSYLTLDPVSTGMGVCLQAGISSLYVTSQLGQLSLASLWAAKLSTSFGWGKVGNITSAGWPITLCGPVWRVSSHSNEAGCRLLYPVTWPPDALTLFWLFAQTWQSSFKVLLCEVHANVAEDRWQCQWASQLRGMSACLLHVCVSV